MKSGQRFSITRVQLQKVMEKYLHCIENVSPQVAVDMDTGGGSHQKIQFLYTDFCLESSMHGLRFVSQPKRHLSERICWVVTFLVSAVVSVWLINDVWTRYYDNPVIVSFTPKELEIDNIPFPAVTICSMNKFPKSELDKRLKIVQNARPGVETEEEHIAKAEIKMIYAACTAQKSFARKNGFAYNRGRIDPNLTEGQLDEDSKKEMVEFLVTNTRPCDQLIRYCVWSEDVVDCKKLFKAIITDYGKCCTFNLLPDDLILRNKVRTRNSKFRKTNYVPRWSPEERAAWKKWDYVKDGFLLNKDLTQPWRQRRAGLEHGLSILIDPDVDNTFCPIEDSVGVRIMMHTPLELPHVHELGTIIGLGQEVFIEIHPEVVLADDDIINFDVHDRKCLFSNEHKLDFYYPYTASNCMDECSSKLLNKRCNCTQYYMPRLNSTNICNADWRSNDFQCMKKERENIADELKTECEYCLSPCEDIGYNMEVTVSNLHKAETLWEDHENGTAPPWAKNQVGIVHMYLGTDSTVPKIRKRLYGTTDLIANTGGLLGLCLGFSVMSLVEIVYFITLRAFWQYKRKKENAKKIANKFMGLLWKSKNKLSNKVGFGVQRSQVTLNPDYRNFYGYSRPTQDAFSNFRF